MSMRTTDDIPASLRSELARRIQDYSVCLLGAVIDSDPAHYKFCGSGTLVQSDGAHHILSAAHVWKEIESCQGLDLTISERSHSFIRPVDVYVPRSLRAAEFGEWGPDLVLARIPPALVPDIGARKSFYNLDLRRDKARDGGLVPSEAHAIWAVIGAPAEMSQVILRDAALTTVTFFTEVETIHNRGEHDYYDLTVLPSTRVPLPHSFGGVSGGGLWAFPVEMNGDGSVRWDGQSILAGVAFYQRENFEGQPSIRCHGPKSLYEAFLRSAM